MPITALFLDIGGVLLTNGWDHHARKRAAANFKLEWAEMEDRHHLNFGTYEEGKLTLEEYLSRVVFYQKRLFTRAQFKRFMFAQSKPYPEMIEMCAQLKVQYGLKIVVVSNEARTECVSDSQVQARQVCGLFCFLLLRPYPQARRGYLSPCAGHRPDASRAGGLYRKHPDVRPDRARVGDSKHSSHGLQGNPLKAGFVRTEGSRMMETSSAKPANPLVLTINGGSSSIKFALYETEEPPKRHLHGKVDRIGLPGTNLTFGDEAGNEQDR
jgi:hypothetical protein